MAQYESKELPKGWTETTLSNVSVANSGVGFPKKFQGMSEGYIPVYKVGDVSKSFRKNESSMNTSEFYVSTQIKNEMKGKIFPVGSTLFAKIGEALRLERRVILSKEGLADNNVMAVSCDLSEMNRFIYQYLRTVKLAEYSRSSTVPSIRKGDVETLNLPLAPLPEQKRIVEKLDSLLAQVDTIQQRLNNLPVIIKRFRQSVLAAAVSGKLTEQWRSKNESKHKSVKFGDLIQSGPQNGIYKPSKFYGKGTKIVRIDSIYDGELISWEKIKCLELESEELKRYQVNISDILINRVNSIEYLGKCGLVRELPESAVFESNIMRLSLNINIASPEFITLFLTSPNGLVELRKNAKLAVNQASINQTDVKNCELILPLLNEQTEIVRLVEQYFALADTLEKNLTNAKKRVDNLTQSILAKAFRGELVPQDPNDEPAEQLLARIKAARLEAEKLEKAAKKAARASKVAKPKK